MYCVRQVTDQLYWVGANDRRLPLFENIHPIPRGISYNSYLLLDEAAVLFDTVDWSACRQLMENLEHLLDGRALDYVVIHHMEPDHGASLQAVLDRWPGVKLVATAMAFRFLDQFGVSSAGHERITVKDGDTRSFGKHTVTFLTAPMVHWPEVMVSFDQTTGALFSADAFGTFGALNGRLFNDEMDFDRDWLDEARRYYANIVGKYGDATQTLLKKAAALGDELKLICPLHGPVWRSDLRYFLDKYDKWSRYEPEEKGVAVIYGSMYGNTEQAADALAAALVERGLTQVSLWDVSSTHVSHLISEVFRLSHVVLASVTYNMGIYPPTLDLLEDMRALNVQNRTFAVLENGTWAPKSGELMGKFVTEELAGCTLLEPKLTLKSSLPAARAGELEALADAIAASVKGE
ncbi:FprA family A-type flavoprotein [Pseudoflavonifractor phocaeensis]|uniref:FprA family A-type flavoprotein n=1 Tax=Pseudoflavonifractor phocaeensis TaxID=1870988 RepID=UPI00313C3735